ncbi:hypothetical protein NHX12_020877 [Muraenolepis orangiensis]|uniref:Protein kinase C and casein kinase substrate in neurons 2 n=1 Tax=Muraenolepis orangiensis TaxID=630683 RepID=A0A9Q0IVJ7_9TELE|nr:hypothetical protein NHX12_020877 [Muraenolepis orangiensis]
MSGSYTDSMTDVSSDSFWEVGNYKRTVKRVDDGNRLCNDLMTCLHERARIEKSYAQQLTDWSKRWRQLIDKGPQYGTLERAWGALCTEAEKVSDLHMEVKSQLMGEDYEKLKNWQRDAYHKQMIGGFKETKEADDGFRKAQKPWAKKLKEVETTKKGHHAACKEEKLATSRENTGKLENNNNPDAQKKLQDKVEKCQQESQKNMEQVFEQCQEFEEKRIAFSRELLLEVKQFQTVYHTLEDTLTAADAREDLKWFHSNHGPGMAMNWPVFETWSVDLNRTLSRRETKKKPSDGVTLTGINQTGSDQPLQQPPLVDEYTPNLLDRSRPCVHVVAFASSMEKSPDWSDEDSAANPFSTNGEGNPFEEEAPSSPEISVAVRALYDYEGQEQDELSFKAGIDSSSPPLSFPFPSPPPGDELTKIGSEDDQGWCKGRLKEGQIGLYPANYVENLQ